MQERSRLWIVFWALMIVAPLAAAAIAVVCIPDVAQVPLHRNISGEVNRWGSPSELAGVYWILGGTMTAVNALMAVFFAFNDHICDMGLVHGVSRMNALKIYVVCAIAMVVIIVAFFVGNNIATAAL